MQSAPFRSIRRMEQTFASAGLPARLVAGVLILLLLVGGGAAAQDAAGWRVPVPQGTSTIVYAPIADAARSGRIEMVEDLVIGGAEDGRRDALFYKIADIAVDARGRIFVLEEGARRVRVFDREGRFLRAFGSVGQGPGDLQRPRSIAVSGETVIVEDRNNARISIWGTDGEHLSDRRIEPWPPTLLGGTDAGLLICWRSRDVQYVGHRELLALETDGDETRTYLDLPFDRTPSVDFQGVGVYDMDGIIPRDRPSFAMSRDGQLYGAPAGGYEVVALTTEGAVRWALRVTSAPVPFEPTAEHTRSIVEEWSMFQGGGARPSDINWPEYEPVIERLQVDGRGNLYVFPWVHPLERTEERAVDVYSPEGARVFSGFMRDLEWDDALEDYVFAVDEDPISAEERVVRYRLELPQGREP